MKNKILFIVEADLKSGSGKCAWELIKLTKERTEFIPVVITQYHNDLNDTCSALCIENHSTHYARTCSLGMGWLGWGIAFCCRPFLNYFSFIKLRKRINFNSICIIHSNSSSIDFGAYLHKKLHIPHVWHIREFLVFNHFWTPIIRNLPQYITQNSNQVITVSNKLNEFLQENAKKTNVQTLYDGVYTPNEKKEISKSNTSNKLRLVCVGNLAPIKGQDFLLEAVCLLPLDILNDISIDFYGANIGNFEQKLKTFARENSIEHIVSFKGFCNDIYDVLPNYDIAIQPSHSEGFSRVTAEYMFAGLCVIAAKEGAIPELIQDRENGFLYEDYNKEELADLLRYCFYNKNITECCAKKAKEKALLNYNFEKNFKKIIDIYDHILLQRELIC